MYHTPEGVRNPKQLSHNSFDLVDRVCDNRRAQRLFQRCESPALPLRELLYSKAKRLEYDGDLAGALNMFYRAFANGERVDSCLKDIAGLLNMMGRTAEAVDFLLSHSDKVTGRAGYDNLVSRLQMELLREAQSDLPKGITVTVLDESLGPVSVALCDRLFPNPAKIKRILLTGAGGLVGVVQFATHSSARKAIQVPKLFSNHQLLCTWSSPYTEARLRMITDMETDGHQFEETTYEEMPVHLQTFGGSFKIPIYRELDKSIPQLPPHILAGIQELARLKTEAQIAKQSPGHSDCELSPTSPGEVSNNSTLPGSPIESMPETAQSTPPLSPLFRPFISDVLLPNGRIAAAMVIPLAEAPIGLVRGEPIDSFRTPLKPRERAACQFKTPSPIVERSLFT